MRINIYEEELTDRVELVTKRAGGTTYFGLRVYLELPVTQEDGTQVKGPFQHGPDDDDTSAVTFWSKSREGLAGLLTTMGRALGLQVGPPAAVSWAGNDGKPRLAYLEVFERMLTLRIGGYYILNVTHEGLDRVGCVPDSLGFPVTKNEKIKRVPRGREGR